MKQVRFRKLQGERKQLYPAVLYCQCCDGPVRHIYDHTEGKVDNGQHRLMFRCMDCGTVRHWGFVQANKPGKTHVEKVLQGVAA